MARQVTTKLPRQAKTLLLMGRALGFYKDKHQYGAARNMFVEAEQTYFNSKNKRTAAADE